MDYTISCRPASRPASEAAAFTSAVGNLRSAAVLLFYIIMMINYYHY